MTTEQKLREALRFTKKPVTIEAIQFTKSLRDAILFDGEPCPDGVKRGATTLHPPTRKVWRAEFFILTLEGAMNVSVGDWIIKGVKGEYYPCKPDIFAATYEPEALALPTTEPSSEAEGWSQYVAGMAYGWIKMNPDIVQDEDQFTKVIGGIIARRIWALKREQVDDINIAESFTNVATLREALQAISHIDDTTNHSADASAALDRIGQIARQALALPTAEQVGEREEFERTMMDKFGWQRNDFKLDDFGYFDGHTDTAWMAWQARAALSAGDVVDAQRYRWLREQHWSNSDICCVDEPKQNVRLGGACPSGDLLDSAIDAAMRKDKL